MRTIDRLRNHPRVKLVEDERAIGNGIIVTLRAGWHYDPLDYESRVRGDDTVTEALAAVRRAYAVPPGVELEPDEDDAPSPAPR